VSGLPRVVRRAPALQGLPWRGPQGRCPWCGHTGTAPTGTVATPASFRACGQPTNDGVLELALLSVCSICETFLVDDDATCVGCGATNRACARAGAPVPREIADWERRLDDPYQWKLTYTADCGPARYTARASVPPRASRKPRPAATVVTTAVTTASRRPRSSKFAHHSSTAAGPDRLLRRPEADRGLRRPGRRVPPQSPRLRGHP
jgi:hypothetical protein